jgi:hypothetical protein
MDVRDPRRSGEACIRYADGSISADALVQEMLAGVDVSDFDAESRAHLHANGVPADALNRLFPHLPPI